MHVILSNRLAPSAVGTTLLVNGAGFVLLVKKVTIVLDWCQGAAAGNVAQTGTLRYDQSGQSSYVFASWGWGGVAPTTLLVNVGACYTYDFGESGIAFGYGGSGYGNINLAITSSSNVAAMGTNINIFGEYLGNLP